MKNFLKISLILMIAFLFSVAYLPAETKAYTMPKEAKYNKYKNKSAATKQMIWHDVKGNSNARSTKAGFIFISKTKKSSYAS